MIMLLYLLFCGETLVSEHRTLNDAIIAAQNVECNATEFRIHDMLRDRWWKQLILKSKENPDG
jgi:hypothetical protein